MVNPHVSSFAGTSVKTPRSRCPALRPLVVQQVTGFKTWGQRSSCLYPGRVMHQGSGTLCPLGVEAGWLNAKAGWAMLSNLGLAQPILEAVTFEEEVVPLPPSLNLVPSR
jgi:hypothetical protein